ncbi:hypothetical protein AGLY_006547 [Aphis glycines]|uniref:Uncharacterized protein n=1 Tax=Aphis glycines TaxID=307491 RepID=A0A6G0TRG6_APHGL|nr:hypothetical protein AGLY_006547 [Aphis glycines]
MSIWHTDDKNGFEVYMSTIYEEKCGVLHKNKVFINMVEMFHDFELRFYETKIKIIQKSDFLYKLLLCQEFKLQTTGYVHMLICKFVHLLNGKMHSNLICDRKKGSRSSQIHRFYTLANMYTHIPIYNAQRVQLVLDCLVGGVGTSVVQEERRCYRNHVRVSRSCLFITTAASYKDIIMWSVYTHWNPIVCLRGSCDDGGEQKIPKKTITIFYHLTISVRLSVIVNLLIFRLFEMGSGLCRNTSKKPRAVQEFDGLYRKIVFNYAKQWTQYSDKRKKNEKNNTKKNKRRGKKPIISGPFPADPDRLHGDKWQYVILTRLDTEPPPKRPPRTKRRYRQDNIASSGVCSSIVRWGSERRQSFGRKRQLKQQLFADESTESMSSRREVVDGGRTDKSTAAPVMAAVNKKPLPAFDVSVSKSSLWVVLWSGAIVAGQTYVARRNGLLKSVARASAMADNLSS